MSKHNNSKTRPLPLPTLKFHFLRQNHKVTCLGAIEVGLGRDGIGFNQLKHFPIALLVDFGKSTKKRSH